MEKSEEPIVREFLELDEMKLEGRRRWIAMFTSFQT